MTDKEKSLEWLYRLKSSLKVFVPKEYFLNEFEQSVDYAISSIKKQDIIQENKEVYTKDEVINIIKDLQEEIDKEYKTGIDGSFPLDGKYDNGYNNGLGMAIQILKSKICKLKEKDNDNRN